MVQVVGVLGFLAIGILLLLLLSGCKQIDKEEPSVVEAVFLNDMVGQVWPGSEYRISYVDLGGRESYTKFTADDYSQIISFYETEKFDEDQLYAFWVIVADYEGKCPADYPIQKEDETEEAFKTRKKEYFTEIAVNTMKKNNVLILEDYPFCARYSLQGKNSEYAQAYKAVEERDYLISCAVVGTIAQMKELCEFGQAIDGWYFHFLSAVRPDLIEQLEEYGFDYDEYCFYGYDSEDLHEDLAKESQPILKVSVELPEDDVAVIEITEENLLDYFEMHTFLKQHKSKYGYVLDAEEQTFLCLKEEYAQNILLRESWISLEFVMEKRHKEATYGLIGNTVFFDGKFYKDEDEETLYDGYYPAMFMDSILMPNYQYEEGAYYYEDFSILNIKGQLALVNQ